MFLNPSKNNGTAFDDTTLTTQMARDFMSQYLLLKKGGQAITEAEISQIANNVLSLPTYTKSEGAVYIALNLKITNNIDKSTVSRYRDDVNWTLKTRSMQVKDGPVSILNEAMNTQNQATLDRLDGIISITEGLIQDLLAIEVPKDAVSVHLGLLNAVSNILASLEAMKLAFIDPVKSYAGTNQYNNNVINFQTALSDENDYFIKKLGSVI